jgi:MATE family multidrug resistance protein
VRAGGNVNWAWWFATAHIFAMAICFYFRFRSGKWKAMRVIEPAIETAH